MMTVAHAEPADIEDLIRLTQEMDSFYGVTGDIPGPERIRQVSAALFGAPPAAYVLLARDDDGLAGFASYCFLWPAAGLTRSLYLKELYVAGRARKQGTGKLLMRHLFDIAIAHDCSRVEWTTDRDNPGAQRFYAQLGVPVKESKLFYRVDGDDLSRGGGAARQPG